MGFGRDDGIEGGEVAMMRGIAGVGLMVDVSLIDFRFAIIFGVRRCQGQVYKPEMNRTRAVGG